MFYYHLSKYSTLFSNTLYIVPIRFIFEFFVLQSGTLFPFTPKFLSNYNKNIKIRAILSFETLVKRNYGRL